MVSEAGAAVLGVKKITKIRHDKNAIFMYQKKMAHREWTSAVQKRKFT